MAIGAPFALLALVGCVLVGARPDFGATRPGAWAGFAYLSVVSAYLGFFPWYAGMARGGVARVGQVQLIQPVLTLVWAVWLLGEPLHARTAAAAALVVASAGLSTLARQIGTRPRVLAGT
jgi:drug/metabolite transporter (DMT)-like permease